MEERVSERTVIRANPAHCYEVLTDFQRYPEWAAEIKAVSIDERDDDGRPAKVTFRAAAFGRSTSYTLRYDYSGAPIAALMGAGQRRRHSPARRELRNLPQRRWLR